MKSAVKKSKPAGSAAGGNDPTVLPSGSGASPEVPAGNAGTDASLDDLKHGLQNGRLAHAYLLVGQPRGNAQALVERFLQLLYCRASEAGPCGSCPTCRQVRAHNWPDMLWIEPQKKSRTIQKEQILALQQFLAHTSYGGGWKTAVLLYAERLNPVASNSLLKTLEEPSKNSLLFLLTESPEFMLPTVLSRCQKLILSESTRKIPAEVAESVADIIAGHDRDDIIARQATASRFLMFLKALRKGVEEAEKREDEVDDGDTEELEAGKEVVEARVEARYREARADVLTTLLQFYRDILLGVCGADERCFYAQGQRDLTRRMAQGLSHGKALRNIDVIENIKKQLEQNLPEALVLDYGFSRLTTLPGDR
ncbi:MAG: hypothetical protein HY343_04915 [Lentisphaerae bacterium]|nr:hypothetical protein [Lentisphaerota bacterium]